MVKLTLLLNEFNQITVPKTRNQDLITQIYLVSNSSHQKIYYLFIMYELIKFNNYLV